NDRAITAEEVKSMGVEVLGGKGRRLVGAEGVMVEERVRFGVERVGGDGWVEVVWSERVDVREGSTVRLREWEGMEVDGVGKR
ncbi:hypothetical protein, partial [Corynebacterium glyciniphilum]|uniref:hypothetical protein n=1 Tax=Corynebacterium glyciniphilum TaxID=1404244 RepID=UPI0016428CE2